MTEPQFENEWFSWDTSSPQVVYLVRTRRNEELLATFHGDYFETLEGRLIPDVTQWKVSYIQAIIGLYSIRDIWGDE